MNRTRVVLAAVVSVFLITATGCWRNHCCESYKPACPAPAPAYYAPPTGCP